MRSTFRAAAYPRGWRLVAATLFAASRLSLPAMLAAILLSHVAVVPVTVVGRFVLCFALPAIAAGAVAWRFSADVRVGDADLVVERAGMRIDVPRAAIARVAPWRVPLPTAGLTIALASGRRLGHDIATPDPLPLLHALAAREVPGAADAATRPAMAYAAARAAWGRWRWPHLVARFPLFALVPTAILFNLHQHIAYGGTFGQYYLVGLRAYLETFAIYWSTVTIYQVLYASLGRGLGELACFAAAAVAPSRAARARRAAELTIRVLYYGGVLALLALRFAPW